MINKILSIKSLSNDISSYIIRIMLALWSRDLGSANLLAF